jgi:hypothetical protein
MSIRVNVDLVFQTHPAEQAETEGKVEEPFIGDGEDDEGWRELKEHDD